MKKLISLATALIMALTVFSGLAVMAEDSQVSVWDGTVPEGDAGYIFEGRGTEEKPYLIRSAEEFALFAANVRLDSTDTCYKGKFFKLTVDIDLDNHEWVPIGGYSYNAHVSTEQTYFAGTFDGDGHVVKNLKIKNTIEVTDKDTGAKTVAPANKLGLFGFICGATIKDFGIESGEIIYNGNKRAGGLVGMGRYAYHIINCFNKANITATANDNSLPGQHLYLGGLVGWSQDYPAQNPDAALYDVYTDSKTIESSYNAGNITVIDNTKASVVVGGVAGNNVWGSNMIDVWNTGDIHINLINTEGADYAAGIVGYFVSDVSFEGIYSIAKITYEGTLPKNHDFGNVFGWCTVETVSGTDAAYMVKEGSMVTTAWSFQKCNIDGNARDYLPTEQDTTLEFATEYGSFMYTPASKRTTPGDETSEETDKPGNDDTGNDVTETTADTATDTAAQTEEEKKGGCGSTVAGSIGLVALAALGVCVIRKKRD